MWKRTYTFYICLSVNTFSAALTCLQRFSNRNARTPNRRDDDDIVEGKSEFSVRGSMGFVLYIFSQTCHIRRMFVTCFRLFSFFSAASFSRFSERVCARWEKSRVCDDGTIFFSILYYIALIFYIKIYKIIQEISLIIYLLLLWILIQIIF